MSLRIGGDRLRAEVRDDGRGLATWPDGRAEAASEPGASDAAARTGSERRGRHGLVNLSYRAGQMGGTLEVRSTLGERTIVSLSVPIRNGDG
jgi:signal transduction histidine kinase